MPIVSYFGKQPRVNLSGSVDERVVVPIAGEARYAQFCLPPFEQICGRTITYPDHTSADSRPESNGGSWKIILDAVENLKEALRFLSANGSFAITQIGRVEREDICIHGSRLPSGSWVDSPAA
jgi:hypothetical protein